MVVAELVALEFEPAAGSGPELVSAPDWAEKIVGLDSSLKAYGFRQKSATLAEREGFEPSMELPPYHLSKMAQ